MASIDGIEGISSTASISERLSLWLAVTSWLFAGSFLDFEETFPQDDGSLDLLTASEVAVYLSLHVETVRRKSGWEIPTAGKIGNQWRYRREEIEEYMKRNEQRIKAYHARTYRQRYGAKMRGNGRKRRVRV
jgi:excisionase family DNA binding protein